MHHALGTNPFLQHAVRHGQMLLAESNRSVEVSRSLVSACDNIIMSINSGNLQGALSAAQNARNMSAQIAQATQQLNQTINERMEMAGYILNRIQFRLNDLSRALQSVRESNTGYANRGVYPNQGAYFTQGMPNQGFYQQTQQHMM
ncbi:hypothetical protein SAMN05660649_02478 [Desulfotomaculum arcticum]|uniref:Flagellin n=1 Tax=Desulfotruncus arcticus DSM 17038 TaxID=1121424 RepID=A0A1I2U3D2_9FIRM|nr:hypothetical protein [Desulfotruncus arcticus]SFG71598.1 hypothetical protein SAMN05660649_02478 [Desulfotomaculum arcticum] [Desulfotruncus arcticus DSM 17038]